ncbi:hypothetical protein TNCV_1328861 [Trichonephila clavipes]|nr:hypothetical protein TNCV_1328861 [Trichonephila clavipes]
MWNYRVTDPRHRETVLLAYGCFSDGGRILSGQLDGEDNIHPIAFGSQKLNPSQQKSGQQLKGSVCYYLGSKKI